MTITQMIETQTQIICLQSHIIDELARVLLQHISAGDMPCLDDMTRAADLMKGLDK